MKPVEQRMPEDRMAAGGEGAKDPDGDAAAPASMPEQAGHGRRSANNDPAGQQGGTAGGGKDNSPP